jgi:STE20-like kinase
MYIEFCGGGAVDSIMVDLEKPLNENQIRYVCHEMCIALAFVHRQHVIHRDLKAGNVLLTLDGEVKLGKTFLIDTLGVLGIKVGMN